MNEEEAIEQLKIIKTNIDKKYINTRNSKSIETVLNLIEKQQAEIEEYRKIELKKDKIIDLMGEKIFEEGVIWENKEDVKQYFERKIEQ